jgi:chromate transporter
MPKRLWELARLFAKLGCISFGGPAVHVALMEEEVVARRRWLEREDFLDLLGASNLIPGPTALEVAGHVGYRRAGLPGLLMAGVAFALPGTMATLALAWAYVAYGGLGHVEPLLAGIRPAVLAILFAAGWRLGRAAVTSWPLAAIGAAVAAASLAGQSEIGSLLAGALLGAVLLRLTDRRRNPPAALLAGAMATSSWAWSASMATKTWPCHPQSLLAATCGAVCAAAGAVSLWQIGLYFLKIGAVLFGGGYVLVAYLQGGLVEQCGWLTQQQLLDAIAVGQLTPGPLVTTAAFVGYLLSPEWPVVGAAIATGAIMLPGLILVAATHRWVARLRRWPWTARFLDALGAASVGLMATVVIALARASLRIPPVGWPEWQNWLVAMVCAGVFLAWRVSAAWIVLLGAALGLLGRVA